MRAPTERSVDSAVFKRTAVSTKAVNLGQIVFRGGIRF